MIGLDTNVLIRYLTRDDLDQWERASQIIQENQPCFISNVVLCEVVWVLRGRPYQPSDRHFAAIIVAIAKFSL